MSKATAIVPVSYNQYYIGGEIFDVEAGEYTGFYGLVAALDAPGRFAVPGQFAVVMTGTETGDVRVSVDIRATTPQEVDLDAWDEVVEVSLSLPGRRRGVTTFNVDDFDLPNFPEPGPYRVRVHARGRDQGQDLLIVEDNPVEEHLILVWPAPPTPEAVHKLTDAYGATIRAS